MSKTLVELTQRQDDIITTLITEGIFKTRSEAIRAGILGLGKEYGTLFAIKPVTELRAIRKMTKINTEIKRGKRKVYTEAEVLKKYSDL